MSKDIATYLKNANLQMASEAILDRQDPEGLFGQLKFGNNRASKFTDLGAAEFAATWSVVGSGSRVRVRE